MALEFRGTDELVYAVLSDDTADGVTYGEVKQLSPLAGVTNSPGSSSAIHYYDNLGLVAINAKGQTTINLVVAVIALETLAEICGQFYDASTGVYGGSTPTPPYCALGYRFKFDDGSQRVYWFLKGKFSIPNEDSNTIDDGTNATNQTLVFTAISTLYAFDNGGSVDHVKADSTENLLDLTGWFDQVQTPDTVSSLLLSSTGGTEPTPTPTPTSTPTPTPTATPTPTPSDSVPDAPVITDGDGATNPVINWSAVSGATSYTVERSASGADDFSVIASDVTALTYTDTSAVAGTSYDYEVIAVNSAGSSEPSNILTITAPSS